MILLYHMWLHMWHVLTVLQAERSMSCVFQIYRNPLLSYWINWKWLPIWKFLVVKALFHARLLQGWKHHGFATSSTLLKLLNECKHLIIINVFYYMVSTLQKLVIPIFGYCDLSIPLLKHCMEDPPAQVIWST